MQKSRKKYFRNSKSSKQKGMAIFKSRVKRGIIKSLALKGHYLLGYLLKTRMMSRNQMGKGQLLTMILVILRVDIGRLLFLIKQAEIKAKEVNFLRPILMGIEPVIL